MTCLADAVERYPSGRARGKAIAAARLAALLYLGGEPAEANKAARTAQGKNIRALDDMYESMVDAIKAVDAEIRQLRDAAVNTLMNGGVDAVQLATTREQWQFPVIKVFADSSQQEPWLLQLPA